MPNRQIASLLGLVNLILIWTIGCVENLSSTQIGGDMLIVVRPDAMPVIDPMEEPVDLGGSDVETSTTITGGRTGGQATGGSFAMAGERMGEGSQEGGGSMTVPDTPCARDEFRCTNGNCIPSNQECDGTAQCADGSDERSPNCEPAADMGVTPIFDMSVVDMAIPEQPDLALPDMEALPADMMRPDPQPQPQPTPIRGNQNGGQRFDGACPNGQVLIGVRGEIRAGADYLGRLGGICGIPILNGGRVTIQMGAQIPARGEGFGQPVEGLCPANQAVTAYEGRAGLLVDQLTLICSSLSPQNGLLVPGPGEPIAAFGGNGGNPFERALCPVGEIAVGHVVRAGDGIDAYGLLCDEVRALLR